MSHYVVIRTEDKKEADVLAAYILNALLFDKDYTRANGEITYYAASEVCEDISKLIVLVKKEDDELT